MYRVFISVQFGRFQAIQDAMSIRVGLLCINKVGQKRIFGWGWIFSPSVEALLSTDSGCFAMIYVYYSIKKMTDCQTSELTARLKKIGKWQQVTCEIRSLASFPHSFIWFYSKCEWKTLQWLCFVWWSVIETTYRRHVNRQPRTIIQVRVN